MSVPVVYDASKALQGEDVRTLREFLEGADLGEKAFQNLLERHPSLLGVLGFSRFVSEQPLYKRGSDGAVILDKIRRDRADILPATESILQRPDGSALFIAHVMELKRGYPAVI